MYSNFTEFFEKYGFKKCLLTTSCTDALEMAAILINIQEGDEVIVPTNTYIATWLAVSHVGATPVPCEPDPTTFNLDPARLEAFALAED